MSATNPWPLSECLAHPQDPLTLHLERVAEQAVASIAPTAWPEIRAIAWVAALFHDLGKATPWFQRYLRGQGPRSELTHHSALGAVLSWWYTAQLDWALWQRLAAFNAVHRHHGALRIQEWKQPIEMTQSMRHEPDHALWLQLAALDAQGIAEWLAAVAARHPDLDLWPDPQPPTPEQVRGALAAVKGSQLRRAHTELAQAVAALTGFGALLAADKIDAALTGKGIERQRLPAEAVTRYWATTPAPAAGDLGLNRRRAQIAAAVAETWLAHLDQRLLTLTAPTGAGKTLAVLNAALKVRAQLAERGSPPRIIYCLPFTSVIDQNHAVFAAVLRANGLPEREDLLLKHHHLVEGTFRSEEGEHQPDGAGQLLTETWQSEIVATTFHQFLHSLLSPLNANLKRAGQLTGALIVLDEVQAIPLRYWETLRRLLITLGQVADARIVLMTATRPLIFQPGDALELVPDHAAHFRALDRTRLWLHHRVPLALSEFAEQLAARLAQDPRPTLIILNRRRAVRALFAALAQALPQRPLVALSTWLTPRDRRARIRLIRRLLRHKRPVVVISTQLVEAGVDLSFPVVHRDLAPLDAIIQSAGRCNRHGEAKRGEVHLWQLTTDPQPGQASEPLWARVYDRPLIEVTSEVLGEAAYWDESDFLALSERYFQGCRARHDQERLDERLACGDLAAVGRDFRLIEDLPTYSLFVCRTARDRVLWERYRALRERSDLSPAEQERQFRMFRRPFMERVIQIPPRAGAGLEREAIHLLEATPTTYDRAAGFIDLPPEEPTCIL